MILLATSRSGELWMVPKTCSAKQQLCTCMKLFCTFLCRFCSTMTWNCHILRRLEDVNCFEFRFLEFNPWKFQQYLTNWLTWNKNNEFWNSVNSLLKRSFPYRRCCRRRRRSSISLSYLGVMGAMWWHKKFALFVSGETAHLPLP